MISFIEKILEFLENTLPVILAPLIIIMMIRIIYQIITY